MKEHRGKHAVEKIKVPFTDNVIEYETPEYSKNLRRFNNLVQSSILLSDIQKPMKRLQISRAFGIVLKTVDGITVPIELQENHPGAITAVSFRISLFNQRAKKFFGKTAQSKHVDCEIRGQGVSNLNGISSGKLKAHFEDPVLFHTCIHDKSLFAVIEIVVDARTSAGVLLAQYSAGWSILDLGDIIYNDTEKDKPEDAVVVSALKKEPVYSGTPRSLLITGLDRTILNEIPGASCISQIDEMPSLSKASRFMQEDEIYLPTDIIPGIVSGTLTDPQLEQVVNIHISNLDVQLPSEGFEARMILDLTAKASRERLDGKDLNCDVSVVERRVNVTVHNGRRAIHRPLHGTLTLDPNRPSALLLQGVISMTGVPRHAIVGLIIQVEYVVRYPIPVDPIPGIPVAIPRVVPIGWTVYLPWKSNAHPSLRRESVPEQVLNGALHMNLTQGPGLSPLHQMVYAGPEKSDMRLSCKVASIMNVVEALNTARLVDIAKKKFNAARKKSGLSEHSELTPRTPRVLPVEPAHTDSGTGPMSPVMVKTTADFNAGPPSIVAPIDPLTLQQIEEMRLLREKLAQSENALAQERSAAELLLQQHNADLANLESMKDERENAAQHNQQPALPPPTPVVVPVMEIKQEAVKPIEVKKVEAAVEADDYKDADLLPETAAEPLYSPHSTRHLDEAGFAGYTNLTRAARAILRSRGFDEILDANGNTPFDVTDLIKLTSGSAVSQRQIALQYDRNREITDMLNRNIIHFQFFYFRPSNGYETPRSLYFTFNFYNFPLTTTQRAAVIPPEQGDRCVLFPMDGSQVPGLHFEYGVTPCISNTEYMDYMRDKSLWLEIWDGDAHMLLGIVRVPLFPLLRQQKSAVQFTEEFDVLNYEKTYHVPTDEKENRIIPPVRGKLLVRATSVGVISDQIPEEDRDANGEAVRLGTNGKREVVRVRPLPLEEPKLANLCHEDSVEVTKENLAANHKHRISRLKEKTLESHMAHSEWFQEKELKIIENWRDVHRREVILRQLREKLRLIRRIYPSFGKTVFLELKITNPYDREHCFTMKMDEDRELRVVRSLKEWLSLKKAFKVDTPSEHDLISDKDQLYLRPRETVYIPIRFQSFASGVVSDSSVGVPPAIRERSIQISFENEKKIPVSVFEIEIHPRPFIVERTFHFFEGENDFLKKRIILDDIFEGKDPYTRNQSPKYLRCSTPSALVASNARNAPNHAQEIFLKYRVGVTGSVDSFYVMLYNDSYEDELYEIWRIVAHATTRVDIASIAGQKTPVSLLLKGRQISADLKSYVSDSTELSITSVNPLVVPPESLAEVTGTLAPLKAGVRDYLVTVIDLSSNELVHIYMLTSVTRTPIISRSFDLAVSVGKEVKKKILFINPYPFFREFHLATSRPDLVVFKRTKLELNGGEETYIGMKLQSCPRPTTEEVLIFVNDVEDKNEDCLMLKLVTTPTV
jgi:hypothetical protein